MKNTSVRGFVLLCIITSCIATTTPNKQIALLFTYSNESINHSLEGAFTSTYLQNELTYNLFQPFQQNLPSFIVYTPGTQTVQYIPSKNPKKDTGTYELIYTATEPTGDVARSMFAITIAPVKAMDDAAFDSELCGKDKFYEKRREQRLIDTEDMLKYGEISDKERVVDAYLHMLKNEHYEHTYGYFPPAHSFMKSLTRRFIDESKVFQTLFHMPKGGNLHIHLFGSAEAQWMATKLVNCANANLFVKGESTNSPVLLFSKSTQVDGARMLGTADIPTIRKWISWPTLEYDDPYLQAALNWESSDAWIEFQNKFSIFSAAVRYADFFKEYVYKVLNDSAAEGVLYVEFRHEPGKLYTFDYNGLRVNLTVDAEFAIISEAVDAIKKLYPFQGVRIIWPTQRGGDDATIQKTMDTAINASQNSRYKELIAGFDLIGEEDKGFTLLHHTSVIQNRYTEMKQKGLSYMFHAGETNWAVDINGSPNQDVSTDENLLDAVLDGSSRLGHAFALFKHPKLMEVVKEKNISIEIAPISNQLLRYAEDIRDHPAMEYMNAGIPICICSDDPGIYGYSYLTYDYYQAFMSWGLYLSDLKVLSQNGILYSSLSESTKGTALLKLWQPAWNRWIEKTYKAASLYNLPTTLEFFNIYCGPQTGGTEVVFDIPDATFAFNLTMQVSCSFNGVSGKGQIWSGTQVKCITPAMSTAVESNVTVAIEGQNFSTNITFLYYVSSSGNNAHLYSLPSFLLCLVSTVVLLISL